MNLDIAIVEQVNCLLLFLGSDGIDDSFGATENTVNFYIQVLKLLVDKSEETAYKV